MKAKLPPAAIARPIPPVTSARRFKPVSNCTSPLRRSRDKAPTLSQTPLTDSKAAACRGSAISHARKARSSSAERSSARSRASQIAASFTSGAPAENRVISPAFGPFREEKYSLGYVLFNSALADAQAAGDLVILQIVQSMHEEYFARSGG